MVSVGGKLIDHRGQGHASFADAKYICYLSSHLYLSKKAQLVGFLTDDLPLVRFPQQPVSFSRSDTKGHGLWIEMFSFKVILFSMPFFNQNMHTHLESSIISPF